MSTDFQNQGLLDASLEIAARRGRTLHEIRALLEDDRDSEALSVMRKFLQVEKKSKPSRSKLLGFPRPAPEKGE